MWLACATILYLAKNTLKLKYPRNDAWKPPRSCPIKVSIIEYTAPIVKPHRVKHTRHMYRHSMKTIEIWKEPCHSINSMVLGVHENG